MSGEGAGTAAALTAAAIPDSKRGSARHARLSEPERKLYLWILRRFVSSGRPSSAETHAAAERLGLEAEHALATLAREDLVHLGTDDEIAVAYPFSGRPTAHRVRFPGGHEVDAMCAIDALGIAPMSGQPIRIVSRDPLTGDVIAAQTDPDGQVRWTPESAVVVAGAMAPGGDSCQGCCPVLNFFVSHASAKRWLSEHPQVRGRPISMQEAAAAGRAVFGDVLAEG